MPSFMVNKASFGLYRSGRRDVELRAVKPQWRNTKAGDVATFLCGKDIFKMKITKVHKGSLARIFLDVSYKRIYPDAATVFEAVRLTRRLYPDEKEFMAFELEAIR